MDNLLADTPTVCEKPFAEHFVVRDYVHVICTKEVRIPQGRLGLAADAVPTRLPNLPAYLFKVVGKPRPERKRRGITMSRLVKKVRLSRHNEHNASLLEDQNSDMKASPVGNHEANPLMSGDLQALANHFSVPRLRAKLNTPDHDVLVYAITHTRHEPLSVFHEKVLCFT